MGILFVQLMERVNQNSGNPLLPLMEIVHQQLTLFSHPSAQLFAYNILNEKTIIMIIRIQFQSLIRSSKNASLVLGTILIMLLMISCTKQDDLTEQKENSKSSGFDQMFKSSNDANATIYNQGVLNNGNLSMIVTQGTFNNTNGEPENGINLLIESLNIDPVNSTSGSHYQAFGNGSPDFNTITSELGDSLQIRTKGYSLGDINQKFYFPMEAKLDEILNNENLSRNNDLVLSWKVDPKNGNNKMALIMLYRGYHSNEIDSSNPIGGQFQIIKEDIVDDGRLTISASELKNTFPKNSFVDLYFIRGTGRNVPLKKGSIDVINFTYDTNSLIFRK